MHTLVKIMIVYNQLYQHLNEILAVVTCRHAGKIVGQRWPTGGKGTCYPRPTNLSEKWRASEAVFW